MIKFPFFNPIRLFAGLLLLAILVAGLSCSNEDDPVLGVLDTKLSNFKIDNLSRTMKLVLSPERFELDQYEEKLSSGLNRWSDAEAELFEPESWSLDPMVQELSKSFQDLPVVNDFSTKRFSNLDSYYLQQNFWAKKLAERLINSRQMGPFEVYRVTSEVDLASLNEDSDPLESALSKLHPELEGVSAEQLAQSLRVFDWVARNIMLLPDNGLITLEKNEDFWRLQDGESNPAAGIPGLGYTRFPFQTYLTSRGDYVDRAKIVMSMLNQLGIDNIMVTVKDDSGENLPWAVGALCGDQWYLFDTKLGLPLQGNSLGTIATFSQLRSNPELLKGMDLTIEESLKDNTKYWVNADQLNDASGLIFCPPEAASYRFWELENRLVGDARMALAASPSGAIEKMPKIEGLTYGVWNIEFQTHQLRRALRDAIAEASFRDPVREKIQWYYSEESYINQFTRYRTARSKYFLGLFETIRNDGNLNAIELFFNMIYKDAKIDSLATDKLFQKAYSIEQGGRSAAEFDNLIKNVQANMRLVRRDSRYFLSHCHFDNGNYSTATNWLTRAETNEQTTRWKQAVSYLKARSLEAQRDYAAAIKIYQKQQSDHFHGDLLRARQLNQLLQKTGQTSAAGTETAEETSN